MSKKFLTNDLKSMHNYHMAQVTNHEIA